MQIHLHSNCPNPALCALLQAVRQRWAVLRRRTLTGLALSCALLLTTGATQAQTGNVLADTSFDIGSGADEYVQSIAVQADGKVLVGGWFDTFNGTAHRRITRLNADGSVDTNFKPGAGASDHVLAMALQSSGKVLVGGWFNTFNGIAHRRITRLMNTDGSVDTSFNPGTGVTGGPVHSIVVQSDDKVLIAGYFSSVNGMARDGIARLDANGSLETDFAADLETDAAILAIALHTDDKLLISGEFTTVNGITSNGIARLNADGSLDTGFNSGPGADGAEGTVTAMAVQPNGQVLIAGGFSKFNGIARNGIARLNADGSLDTSFDPGAGADDVLESIVWQPDGKVLVAGSFTTIDNRARKHIARLNANGSLDTGFDPGMGTDEFIMFTALQPDGKVLIAGDFTTFNGAARSHIARLVFPVTATASAPGGHGSISLGAQTVMVGDATSFTLAPDAGYVVDTVTGTCVGSLSGNTYTVAAVTADCTVIASFKPAGTGSNPAATATPVSSLGPWGLAGLLGLLGLFGGLRLRRRV